MLEELLAVHAGHMDVDDGEPPPDFNLVLQHNTFYTITFHGSHSLAEGDIVRFMPFVTAGGNEAASCEGAHAASEVSFGGALDAALTTSVKIASAAADGTLEADYFLCLADFLQRR